MSGNYDDIIHLPHHVSETRPHMSNYDRAAQFSPFAALTGYGAAITETARLTDSKIELDDGRIQTLNAALQLLQAHIKECPEVAITYFQSDARKQGGAYRTLTGKVWRINAAEGTVVLTDKAVIPIADIFQIDGPLLRSLYEDILDESN